MATLSADAASRLAMGHAADPATLVPAEKGRKTAQNENARSRTSRLSLIRSTRDISGIIPDDRHLSHIVRPGQDDQAASSSDDLQNRRLVLVPVAGTMQCLQRCYAQ